MAKGYHRVVLRVPFKDVDEYSTVWYGHYLAYFDIARTELLRIWGLPPSEMASLGFQAPVIGARIKYHRPARNDDEIIVEVRPKVHRTAQISFLFRVLRKDDKRLLVTGETSHALKSRAGVLLYVVPPVLAEKMESILRDLGETEEVT
jgi:acyl-CoA thioester hydrolase